MKKLFALLLTTALILGLAACGAAEPEAKKVDLNTVYAGYADLMPDMFQPDADTMLNFLGIETADCTQAVVYICADGMRTDEVWLLEAKDAETLEKLKGLAEVRIQAKADETVSYAPDQYAVVQKAELLVNGNYLALLVSPEVDTMKAGFEAAFQ